MVVRKDKAWYTELYEERAGILEFDGGYNTKDAQLYAHEEIKELILSDRFADQKDETDFKKFRKVHLYDVTKTMNQWKIKFL